MLILLCVVLLCVFAFSAFKIISTLRGYKIAEENYNALSQQFVTTAQTTLIRHSKQKRKPNSGRRSVLILVPPVVAQQAQAGQCGPGQRRGQHRAHKIVLAFQRRLGRPAEINPCRSNEASISRKGMDET